MTNSKVYGTRIKVKKIFEKKNPLEPEVFKDKVEIVDIGIALDAPHLKVGQILLLTPDAGMDFNGFTYIVEQHILEIFS